MVEARCVSPASPLWIVVWCMVKQAFDVLQASILKHEIIATVYLSVCLNHSFFTIS